jgi:hypothetical protein
METVIPATAAIADQAVSVLHSWNILVSKGLRGISDLQKHP